MVDTKIQEIRSFTGHRPTDEQLEIIQEIEELTGGYVRFEQGLAIDDSFAGWIENDSGDELSYLADRPKTSSMTVENIREEYPEELWPEFFSISPEDSCNVLSSWKSMGSFEDLLTAMAIQSELIYHGWHIGKEEDYIDPFLEKDEPLGKLEIEIIEQQKMKSETEEYEQQ